MEGRYDRKKRLKQMKELQEIRNLRNIEICPGDSSISTFIDRNGYPYDFDYNN